MKKIVYLLLLCFVTFGVVAQTNIDGPIDLPNGLKLKTGDTITLASGTLPSGSFKFVFQKPNMLSMSDQPLTRHSTGLSMPVKRIQVYKSKKRGDKYYAIVNPGGFNYMVDVFLALDAGEIKKINNIDVSKANADSVKPNSVADELIKLKSLLDSGAITQDEYNAQKKKLLSQ